LENSIIGPSPEPLMYVLIDLDVCNIRFKAVTCSRIPTRFQRAYARKLKTPANLHGPHKRKLHNVG
jgi:hypothetical protein